MKPFDLSPRLGRRTAGALALLLCLSAGAASAQPPTVNGLFYGDGDDAKYTHWNTSLYGSKLYVYVDVPSTRLYVALVVDRSVNDNVFGASHAGFSGNYMQSAGWGAGGGQQRSASALTNSEFASFEFACAPDTPNRWAWQQGYACLRSGTWVSDSTCGTSAVLEKGFPPSWQSASSFARNINTWNAQGTKPWNLHVFGTNQNQWKSPFSASNPNTDPPNNPNTVIGLEGYPATGQIGYNSTYLYEWSMVYEWSIDVGPNGTNCGDQALFLITGASHHSPMKAGVEGEHDDVCGEENDCFEDDGETPDPLSDFGDLPDNYGTLSSSSGPQHYLTVTGPYLGQDVLTETDGQPTSDASGDGSEEDGVTANVTSNWTAGSTQSIDVDVSRAPSGALLGGWFDWNGDGDFNDSGEFFTWNVTEGTNTLSLTVGSGFEWQNDTLYARFRIVSTASKAPGGNGWQQADSVGTATDGEVEDYVFTPGVLPVTLNAFTSEGAAGGELTVRWQTASETDNVAFELLGRVGGEWQRLTDLVPSRSMNSGLPQSYEVRVSAPPGLTDVQLVDYDTRGRAERFGAFRLGESYGEFQRARPIDWTGPRAERAERLRERGFADTARERDPEIARRRAGQAAEAAGVARWKKVRSGAPVAGPDTRYHGASALEIATRKGKPGGGAGDGGTAGGTVQIETGAMTHVAVTEAGIQRVTYEALRDGGLDLAGVHGKDVAVTWRGEPVARWIDGPPTFGPGSALEFLGRPPRGDDALYIDAALYQVSVDPTRAREAGRIGQGKAKSVSPSYLRETWVDRPALYRTQSPTGDPWVDRSVLTFRGRTSTVTLDLPIAGPMASGTAQLALGLGSLTDLPDLRDASGAPIPEHEVEVWVRAASSSSFVPVTSASTSGQTDWTVETTLPAGSVEPGLNQVQLRFSTDYLLSLVVVDRYGVRYPSPYLGPSLDFARDPWAGGYVVEGFAGPAAVAYAEAADGSLTRVDPRVVPSGGGYTVELRQMDAARFWVTEAPHAPEVFTTEAPPDLLGGPADLVVIAGSSFVGTRALEDYVAAKAAFDPVVIDVEDVYNAVGYGMALPAAITDYLAARDAVYPFSHVQIVGADCFDRLSYISQCVSFVPLPTARVAATYFSPSHNRLADLDGDGIADKAVGQFSVRDEAELATIVAKGSAWEASGLSAEESALLIAEESDGVNNFLAQIQRLKARLGWSDAEVLDLAQHPSISTARSAMRSSLEGGRALTLFSGHSSPTVWAFRSLLTTGTAAALTNHGLPTIMVPLACETTFDISPNANVLGHQLLFAGDRGALAISGAVSLSGLMGNERMTGHVFDGLKAGLTLGEAVQAGRDAIGSSDPELQDNWITQGDVTVKLNR